MTRHAFDCITLGRQLRNRERSPADILQQCLTQIERFEKHVRAWVLIDVDGARKQAAQYGDELAAGKDRSPLHGIPIAIKDIIDVEGWPTLAGSPIRAGHRAEHDAEIVTRLRAAGAVILGKTVTTEFASFDPPPTRNPWNLARTPGGSSSGSAAAVAAQMCPVALGSQTGGSITRPVSFCGVAGCKPTFGEVSCDGIVPLSPNMDHPGPIARTAKDLAIVLRVLTGRPGQSTDADRGAKSLGLLETFFMEEAAEPVRAATLAAIERLKQGGWTVRPVPLPREISFPQVVRMHRRIMAYEAAEYHQSNFRAHRDQYGPNLATLLAEGLALGAHAYEEAIEAQCHFKGQMQDLFAAGTYDALVMPATVTTAPDTSTTGDPRFNSPWSYGGLPTVSIPCGLAPDGLPTSLQFVGPAGKTFRLLDVAADCEEALDFSAVPPLLSEVS